jgi:two-component system, sensor histidine kinase and response regulator
MPRDLHDLPLRTESVLPAAEASEPPTGLPRDVSRARVLLVEDNHINREVTVELLKAVGLTVDVACDGHEAVAHAGLRRYDLVLMDVQMPGLDGLEATRRIRTLAGHGATPIVAMTASAFSEDRAACLAAGMNDHIGKPFDPHDLMDVVAHWLPALHAARGAESGDARGSERPAATTGPAAPAVAPAAAASAVAPAAAAAAVAGGTATDRAGRAAMALSPGHRSAASPAPAPLASDAPAAARPWVPIDGLTPSRALTYLPGHEGIYRRVLARFAADHGHEPPLKALARDAQWAALRQALHALRGSLGAIGAVELQREALDLEQCMHRPSDHAERMRRTEAFDDALRGLVSRIAQACAVHDLASGQSGG